MTQSELENKLAVLLGGRAAESICFSEISTGVADDSKKATEIARSSSRDWSALQRGHDTQD